MSMKWWTASWNKSRGRGAGAMLPSLTLMLALALTGCSLAPQQSAEAENIELIKPPNISKKPEFTVAQSTIETKVSATGKLMSERQEELYWTADTGQIAEIKVEPGEIVKKGQVIALLHTGNLDSQIKRKELQVKQAELGMIEKLRDEDRSPIQQELDKLDYELLVQELDELKAQLAASRLTAPFDGTLVSFSKKVGDSVKAYEEIGVIADLDRLVVAARFSSTDLQSIAVGMDASVGINTKGTFTGKVARLPLASSSGGEDSLDQYVLIQLDGFPDDAQSGTPLSASVVTERKDNAVLIPPAALRTVSGRNYVQVVDAEGGKREVDVEVGLSTSTEVEIVKGLEPGQKVIGK